MGRFIKPEVILLAETKMIPEGREVFLKAMGVPEWKTDAASDAEELMEIAGKTCYLSFSLDLNKNLTKVGTRGNFDYLQKGIVATKHGSVLEHAKITFAFLNVSRVFTHELVRHRHGSYSQVSGRYVRTDSVDMYYPEVLRGIPGMSELFKKAIATMEDAAAFAAKLAGLDEMKDFTMKKKITSAIRRLIGNGQANHIIATYNHRDLRHIIQQRTSRHAEEEIRYVFGEVFELLKGRYPAVYADTIVEVVDGMKEVTFESEKI